MKICIDAGHNHSGVDTGASGALYKEQDLTFLIADELKNILVASGIDVVMTRNSITDNVDNTSLNASLKKRAEIANKANCDAFISIHINAGGGVGTETYVHSASSKAYETAVKIQEGFKRLGRVDRGVKTANLAVLRDTKMPALLVECGFIDNAEEEKWIMESRNRIAASIASAFGADEKTEYVSAAEAIAILTTKGIITEPVKWYSGTWNDDDFKWLLRKFATYIKEV